MRVLFIWANIPIDVFAVVNAVADDWVSSDFPTANVLDAVEALAIFELIERNALVYLETNEAGDSFESSPTKKHHN